VTNSNADLVPKRLQLVHELAPTATVIALLVNPTSPTLAETSMKEAQVAAQTLGLQLHVLHAAQNAISMRPLEPRSTCELARS
jgi:putative ABC transport system substrate-binding protein